MKPPIRTCFGVLSLLAVSAGPLKADSETGAADRNIESYRSLSRSDALREIADNPDLADQRTKFLREMRGILAEKLIERPASLEELREARIVWDSRYETADPTIREVFALGRSDAMAADTLVNELPELASAYVLSGDRAFLDRALAEMEELTTWIPFQRPGWTSFSRKKLPPDGGDGVWLATGRIIQALTDTLEILPEEDVPEELVKKIKTRLAEEAELIVADWKAERPWYVQQNEIRSNQWAIPIAGLINATVYLGREEYADAYEFGIQNLLKTLDSQGQKGAFNEGLVYGNATVKVILSAARQAALAGDRRLIDHPFLKNFPVWHAQHLQPGGYVINSFDCGFGARGGLRHFFSTYSDMAVLLGSAESLWVVKNHPEQSDDSINGIIARSMPDNLAVAPPLFGDYPVATQINWRSSWNDDASGFWMRGGAKSDFHDHMDRGHVNFIVDGRAILIEAGTPSYGLPGYFENYVSIAGHNVLQVGDFDASTASKAELAGAGQPLNESHRSALIVVSDHDASGGTATIDLSSVYPAVKKWVRHVKWTADALDVRDEVVLKKSDVILFRWHLGSPTKDVRWAEGTLAKEDVELAPGLLSADGYQIEYEGDQELAARLEVSPDQTLGNKSEHHCLVVRSAEPVDRLVLTTRVRMAPASVVDAASVEETSTEKVVKDL